MDTWGGLGACQGSSLPEGKDKGRLLGIKVDQWVVEQLSGG